MRAILVGPFALKSLSGKLAGAVLTIGGLLLTQVGVFFLWVGIGLTARASGSLLRLSLVWLVVLFCYVGATETVVPAAALAFGRVPLNCYDESARLQPYNVLYCLTNRNYVTLELADTLSQMESRFRAELSTRKVQYLDAGFPFGGGFPMLPHLSHGDGRRVDFAFFYVSDDGNPTGRNGSFIGYFAFIEPAAGESTTCPKNWLTLRWDLEWLQGLLHKPKLDLDATRRLLLILAESPGIGKILLEPHLKTTLRLDGGKIRFQGCHASRHDDHVHVQL